MTGDQGTGAAAARQGHAGPDTILLVDDEPGVRMLAERILRREGFDVVTKDSAAAALAWWAEHQDRVALVVTDTIMPDVTGPQMLARMRRDRGDLRAVVMSGYVKDAYPQHAPLPTDRFLQKPFSSDELRTAVRDQLTMGKAGTQRGT